MTPKTMWSTRDVLLMTFAAATLTMGLTVIANRKFNDMIEARAAQKSVSMSMSPMHGVLGNMKKSRSYVHPREHTGDNDDLAHVPTPVAGPVDSVPPRPKKHEERPQGSGERWTPL